MSHFVQFDDIGSCVQLCNQYHNQVISMTSKDFFWSICSWLPAQMITMHRQLLICPLITFVSGLFHLVWCYYDSRLLMHVPAVCSFSLLNIVQSMAMSQFLYVLVEWYLCFQFWVLNNAATIVHIYVSYFDASYLSWINVWNK